MDEVSGRAPNPRDGSRERYSPSERDAFEPGFPANGRSASGSAFAGESRWGGGRPSERDERREERRGGRAAEPLDQRLERWVSRGRELVDGVSGARPGARPVPAAGERRAAGAGGGGLPPQGNGGLGAGGLSPTRLGRWVEERLDWLLDDDSDDDWREPWQAAPSPRGGRRPEGRPEERFVGREDGRFDPITPPPRTARREPPAAARPADVSAAASSPRPAASGRRRSLEAISRRPLRVDSGPVAPPPVPPVTPSASAPPAAEGDGWGEAWPDDASFSLNRWQRPLRSRAPDPLQAPPPPSGPTGLNGTGAGGRPLPRSTRRR